MQLNLTGDRTYRPETLEKYVRVKELLREGKKLGEATDEAGLNKATYQQIRKDDPEGISLRPPRAGEKRKYTKRANSYVDLPLRAEPEPNEKEYVIVVRTPTSQLKDVLEQLK